ncbi:pectinesterase inhibitor-like [Senna tora]|uniref:Pectinesterase inhibitor-like n=1 Tax=Senna tora TaxID=362788 RepID=A0A834WDN7_9FABA|nr:pectinesterase inhibitor-like [Senna tora]
MQNPSLTKGLEWDGKVVPRKGNVGALRRAMVGQGQFRRDILLELEGEDRSLARIQCRTESPEEATIVILLERFVIWDYLTSTWVGGRLIDLVHRVLRKLGTPVPGLVIPWLWITFEVPTSLAVVAMTPMLVAMPMTLAAMAAAHKYYAKPSMTISSLLVAVFLCHYPLSSYSTETVPIQEICSKHTDPSFCFNVLAPKAGLDLATLEEYTIMLAKSNAFDTITSVNSLIGNTSDPQLKQHYVSCSMDYNLVLEKLADASEALSSEDYNGVSSNANGVISDITFCDSNPPGLDDPSSLPKYNKDLEGIGLIIVIIANFLAHNY